MQHASHAKVVPSFFAKFIHKNLVCRIGEVSPSELTCWTRPGPLTEKSSQELRQQAITRLRSRFDPIWNSEISIPAKEGWLELLTSTERQGINKIVKEIPIAQFQFLTLREVKKKLAIPVDQILSILARMEAIDWAPSFANVKVPQPALQIRQDMSEEARHDAERVANLDWVTGLKPTDIRFPCPEGNPLSNQILKELALPQVAAWLPSIVERLSRAMAVTISEEIHEVGATAAAIAKKRLASDGQARWASIFFSRYDSKSGRSLHDVGVQFDLTRERIRQICDALLQVTKKRSVKLPVLEQVLTDVAALTPISEEDANKRFADQLGSAGIVGAIDFAREIGIENIRVKRVEVNSRKLDRYVTVSMIESSESSFWMQKALSYANKDCSLMGCTNLFRIAGLLSIRDGFALGKASLESLMQQAPGYRSLIRMQDGSRPPPASAVQPHRGYKKCFMWRRSLST